MKARMMVSILSNIVFFGCFLLCVCSTVFLFVYFWLPWVFIAMRGLSLVVVLRLAVVASLIAARWSRVHGLSSPDAQA